MRWRAHRARAADVRSEGQQMDAAQACLRGPAGFSKVLIRGEYSSQESQSDRLRPTVNDGALADSATAASRTSSFRAFETFRESGLRSLTGERARSADIPFR